MTLFELFSSTSFNYFDENGFIYIVFESNDSRQDIDVMVAAGGTYSEERWPHVRFEHLSEDVHMALIMHGRVRGSIGLSECKLYKDDLMKKLLSSLKAIYRPINPSSKVLRNSRRVGNRCSLQCFTQCRS